MSKDNKENIYRELDFFGISISNRSRVLIIGGGKAAYIKARTLVRKGVNVTALAKEFNDDLAKLSGIKLIESHYYKEIINEYHIIIIALNNDIIRKKISTHCDELFKLYIDCTNYKEGLAIMQSQGSSRNIVYSVNTKVGVPRLSKLLLSRIRESLIDYDDFVLHVSNIRKKAKTLDTVRKKEVIDFICSEDFKFFYDKKIDHIVLKIFFQDVF